MSVVEACVLLETGFGNDQTGRGLYLVLLAREIVGRFDNARDAFVKICPASVVGAENRKRITRRKLQGEVDLAILP